MMEANLTDIEQLDKLSINTIQYHPVKSEDEWKISVIKECMDANFGKTNIGGFSTEEIDETRLPGAVPQPLSLLLIVVGCIFF